MIKLNVGERCGLPDNSVRNLMNMEENEKEIEYDRSKQMAGYE